MSTNVTIVDTDEKRRRFTPEEKQLILQQAMAPDVNVSAVARIHGMTPSLLFKWKRDFFEAAGKTDLTVKPSSFVRISQEPEGENKKEDEQDREGEVFFHVGNDMMLEFPPATEIKRIAEIVAEIRRSV